MAGIELEVGDESHSGSKNVMFDDMLKLVRAGFIIVYPLYTR